MRQLSESTHIVKPFVVIGMKIEKKNKKNDGLDLIRKMTKSVQRQVFGCIIFNIRCVANPTDLRFLAKIKYLFRCKIAESDYLFCHLMIERNNRKNQQIDLNIEKMFELTSGMGIRWRWKSLHKKIEKKNYIQMKSIRTEFCDAKVWNVQRRKMQNWNCSTVGGDWQFVQSLFMIIICKCWFCKGKYSALTFAGMICTEDDRSAFKRMMMAFPVLVWARE